MAFKISSGRALAFCYILVLVLANSVSSQSLDRVAWKSKQVAPGLTWKNAHVDLFGARQNINILEIDLRKREVTLVYNPQENRPTSALALASESLAAVNAGFFDVKNGGSVTYLKVDGQIGQPDTTKWKTNQNLNGTLIIKKNGRFEVEKVAAYEKYTNRKKYDDVLVTGALLMDEGKVMELAENPFVDSRHPRTCLGIVNKNKVLLVTVDGRNEQASGMTLVELTLLMQSLNCKEAINLDGGGSTTMWISTEASGVVNRPSDNRKFDHLGERKVSNILVVKQPR